MKQLSKEFCLLLYALFPERLAKPKGRVNWDHFAKLVIANKVILALFQQKEYLPAPDCVLQQIKQQSQWIVCRELQQTTVLIELIALLEEAVIPVLTFKGQALSCQLYGSPYRKVSSDVDILIPEEHLDAALERLLAHKYVSRVYPYRYPYLEEKRKRIDRELSLEKNGVMIDLHWRFFGDDSAYQPTFSELWQRRETVCIQGVTIPTLSLADSRSYVLWHAYYSDARQLTWLLDVATLYQKEGALPQDQVAYQDFLELSACLFEGKSTKNRSIATTLALMQLREPGFFYRSTEFFKKVLLPTSQQDWLVFPLPRFLFFLYYPLRPFLWFLRRVKPIAARLLKFLPFFA